MTPGVFLLLAGTVGVAAFIQGTVGMGFALIVAPVCGLVAPGLLPVALLVLMLPLNCYVAWRERAHLDLNGAGWITLGRTVGALLGLWILTAITRGHLDLLIGLSTVLAALVSLCAPAFEPGRMALIGAGMVTGVTETATGIGGPPLALVYQHHQAPILRSTMALCFAVGEIISLALFLVMGLVHARLVGAVLALVPFLAAGAYLSEHAHHHVQGALLRTFVIVFAVISGTLIIIKAYL
jgi:uncharacterized membrane protein YfcA